jgi:flagellar biosynthetic protein FliR
LGLDQLLPADAFAFLIVFARIGAAMMVLPGFGEIYVLPRTRLLLALAVTVVVAPLVSRFLPAMPPSPLELFLILGAELVIGLFLGTLVRMLISALHVAGTIVGFQSSLASASMFDPANAQQGSLIGTFLGVMGIVMVFVADLHHPMLNAVVDSYTLFSPGGALPWDDFSDLMTRTVAHAFALGMQIAAPFLVVGLVFYLGLGLINRLMPQMQVFFIAMPLQIALAFFIMALTISAAMLWFLNDFQGRVGSLLS